MFIFPYLNFNRGWWVTVFIGGFYFLGYAFQYLCSFFPITHMYQLIRKNKGVFEKEMIIAKD